MMDDYRNYKEVDFEEYWALIQTTVREYITSVSVDESTKNQRKE